MDILKKRWLLWKKLVDTVRGLKTHELLAAAVAAVCLLIASAGLWQLSRNLDFSPQRPVRTEHAGMEINAENMANEETILNERAEDERKAPETTETVAAEDLQKELEIAEQKPLRTEIAGGEWTYDELMKDWRYRPPTHP